MTSVPLIFRYPWHSVDSAAWKFATMNGALFVPQLRDGAFIFDDSPLAAIVSANSAKNNKDVVRNFGPTMRQILEAWLNSIGLTTDGVSLNWRDRMIANVRYFSEVSKARLVAPPLTRSSSNFF